jgi:hypothetical protein
MYTVNHNYHFFCSTYKIPKQRTSHAILTIIFCLILINVLESHIKTILFLGMWLLPKNSSEEVQEPGPSTGGMDPLESENKIALPVTLINYYKHAFRVVGGYSKILFEVKTRHEIIFL